MHPQRPAPVARRRRRVELAPPKNGKVRTVYIGEEGVASLLRYKAVKAAQLGWEPDGWLLSHDGGITPMRAKSVTAYFSTLAKRAGVDADLHTLRHWSATELNRQGIDLPTAAAQLGHTTTVMAKTYLHTDVKRGAAAGDRSRPSSGPSSAADPGSDDWRSTRALVGLVGHGAELRERWVQLPFGRKRAVIEAVIDQLHIDPAPVRGRNSFDRSRISIDRIAWRV